ncbi:MAG: ABC transporter permease subunit [Planctomycetota bacterium]|nr:ABC transporter permease subunit [Planctomycetota bacterium]
MVREYRFQLYGMLAYFVVLEILLAAAILFWPDFEGNLDALRSMAPLEALKGIVDQIGEAGVSAYVNGQHFFKGCNTVGMLAAVIFAMGAVAGEAQRGTLEIWLARPLSRRRILLERFVAGAIAVTLPVFVSSATVPWLLDRVHEEMEFRDLMLGSLHQSIFLIAIYGITFFFSCVSSRPVVIAFVMLMFTIFEFALYMIQDVTHISIFRLADIDVFANIGATHGLDLRIVIPMLAVIAMTLWGSLAAFARRVP